jgi:hypothetical protein
MNHPDFDEYSQQVSNNVKNVFGIEFPSSQDWHTATSHNINVINNGNNIIKAQILMSKVNKDESISLTVLNEATFNDNTESLIYFDLPNVYDHLYVAFIDKDNQYFYKSFNINQTTVYFKENNSNARSMTRGIASLPAVPTLNEEPIKSYANERNWVNDWLYSYNYYTFAVDDYDDAFKTLMNDIIFNYLPNGRKYNNTPQFYKSGYYNESSYLITTGDEPIIVSPVYKNDGGYQEICNGDLYYYYYKAEQNISVEELEILPKYKAVILSDLFTNDVNNIFEKSKSYALIFWGDDTHASSYIFPAQYKIGFMYRSRTTSDNKKKQGEIYLDGRLNTHINGWGNFKTSKLRDTDPRMGYAKVNDKTFLCVESGTDADFNDLIVELEGGFQPLTIIRDEYESQFYTFCFEDSKLGDYDMNDVVLKGRRINSTKVEYTLMACGANDDLYIHNIDGNIIKSDKEVHTLFGKSHSQFINTILGDNIEYITDVITVNKNFSFLDATTQPYIFDKTKNWEVHISRRGEDPHAIMIPYDFAWPLERICIRNAYLQFNNWGVGSIEDTDWYKYPEENMVFVFE